MTPALHAALWFAEVALPALADWPRTGGLNIYLDAPPRPGPPRPFWPMSPLQEEKEMSKHKTEDKHEVVAHEQKLPDLTPEPREVQPVHAAEPKTKLVRSPAVPKPPCCGDHIHIPFKVDQELKDAEGKVYAVRVTQYDCVAPGAVPASFVLNLDQLPKAEGF